MDIIFFALLTFYIFFKLSQHLGKIDEEEKKQIEDKIALMKVAQEQVEKIIKQQEQEQEKEKLVGAASTKDNVAQDQALQHLNEVTKTSLTEIFQRGKMNLPFFLEGAKSAFEMVLKAFAAADLPTLKSLLSEKLYQGFEAAVNQRKSEQKTLITNLISIDKAEIASANLSENDATIAVKFTSKQINYIVGQNEEVLEGSKNEIQELSDIWTFKKDLTSANPNWIISATGT